MADTLDPIVQKILDDTKPGEDEHKTRTTRFDRSYEIYRALEPKGLTQDRKDVMRIRAPYAMEVIDTAMVNMVTGPPRCKVLPRTPAHADQAKAFQLVMDYHARRDHLAEKVPVMIQQGLVYGVTVGKNHWLYQEDKKTLRGPGGQPHDVTVTTYDGPSFEPWDVYDAWWDPAARSVDSAAYVILRSWPDKESLLANSCSVESRHDLSECDGIFHNVQQLLASGTTQRRGTTSQDRLLNSQPRKDRFEVWECWKDDRVTIIGNRKILMRDAPNPHWHGKKPVVVASTRPDMFKLQGIPETELVRDLQQALWTIQNLRMDEIHLTTWRGFTYREGGVIDPTAIKIKPRALIPVTDHDDLRPIEMQPLPPEAYQEERALLATMQSITGITPYISGADAQNTDQNTATGIATLSEAASRLLRFKAEQIHDGIWQRTFEQWGADVQQFMTDPIWVQLVGPGGDVQHHQVDPQEVVGEFDFRLVGTDEALSRQQERSEALGLLNAFAPLAQLGIVNMQPILEKVAEAYNFDNPAALMAQPQQQAPAAPVPQNGQGGGYPPGRILGPTIGTPMLTPPGPPGGGIGGR